MPAAVFVFRVHNPTQKAQEVSLAGLMINPVGYDAAGPIEGQNHPNFGGNVNEAVPASSGAMGLEMRAEPGGDPAIAGRLRSRRWPISAAWPRRRTTGPRRCELEVLDQPPNAAA